MQWEDLMRETLGYLLMVHLCASITEPMEGVIFQIDIHFWKCFHVLE